MRFLISVIVWASIGFGAISWADENHPESKTTAQDILALDQIDRGASMEDVLEVVGSTGNVVKTSTGETWHYNFTTPDNGEVIAVIAFDKNDKYVRYRFYARDAN
ncbi:MAG: hypothetical protein AAF292_07035 [Pseudomonadota bacterium]